jgi:hypothetical protein
MKTAATATSATDARSISSSAGDPSATPGSFLGTPTWTLTAMNAAYNTTTRQNHHPARGRRRAPLVLYLPAMALMLVDRKSHRGVAASERWPAS